MIFQIIHSYARIKIEESKIYLFFKVQGCQNMCSSVETSRNEGFLLGRQYQVTSPL